MSAPGVTGPLRLEEHPFFQDLEGDLVTRLRRSAVERTYTSGDMLVREGDLADRFILVFEGKVALEVVLPDRPRVTIQTLGRGEVVGWSWVLPPFRWRLDARAVKRTRTLEVPAPLLQSDLAAHPADGYRFLLRLLPVVAERLENTQVQLVDIHGY